MNRLLILAVLLLTLSVETPAFSADFLKGLNAYRVGDYTTAMHQWKPLAENRGFSSYFYSKRDVINAQYNLGVMYANGRGVPKDDETAVKWYTLAAKQGLTSAQYNLGFAYYNGEGVPKHFVHASMWWHIAASSGYENAIQNRNILAGMMTPANTSTAHKLADECVRNEYKGC